MTESKGLQTQAERGDAEAQFRMGYSLAHGEGVVQNDAEAVRWYRLGAEQGNATAQNNLGYMYDEGRGVPQDDVEAVRWYRLAAEQGVAEAQYNLGVMYSNGHGVPQDYAEAARWSRLAAEQGDAAAQAVLARCYLEGRGVPQDYAEAHLWSNLAAVNAKDDLRNELIKIRDQAATHFSGPEILELQGRAREWTETTSPGISPAGGSARSSEHNQSLALWARPSVGTTPAKEFEQRVSEAQRRQVAPANGITSAVPVSPSDVAPAPRTAPPSVSGVYAGFWWRTLAYVFDGMITNVVLIFLYVLLGFSVSTMLVDPPVAAWVVGGLTNWLYFTLWESSEWQATPGKRMLHLVVTDLHGRRLGFGQASGRCLSKIFSYLLLGVGFLMVGFTEKKQGLHDEIAGTVVVRVPPS